MPKTKALYVFKDKSSKKFAISYPFPPNSHIFKRNGFQSSFGYVSFSFGQNILELQITPPKLP